MLITVFTPTYNRAHTISRTFGSLCKQKIKDFEWLIVDDGSTDETEILINAFKKKAEFPIVYVKKNNGGKHTAHNEALKYAKGDLFFTVDSDDWLPDSSLSQIKTLSAELLKSKELAGIVALKELPEGIIISDVFPKDLHVSSLLNLERIGKGGERSLVFKTEILRRFPFPVIGGERFMSESVIYDRLGCQYSFLISNSILTTCEYQPDGLSAGIKKLMSQNPCGYAIYYSQRVNMVTTFRKRIGMAVRFIAFRLKTQKHLRPFCTYSGTHKLLLTFLYPFGYLVKYYYR